MGKEKPSTKFCKHCKTEIPYSAKVCPQCRKKQGLGGCLTAIIIVVCLGLIGSCFGGGTKDKSASDNKPESTKTGEAPNNEPGSENPIEEESFYSVGDSVEVNKDIIMTILSAGEYQSDNQFIQPEEGKLYYKIDIEVQNNSSKDTTVSSIISMEAYVDDYAVDQSYAAGIDSALSGSLAAGKKIKGSVIYEINRDFSTLELQYKPNVWLKDKVVFQFLNQ